MKARPRAVENRVADHLNLHFDTLGLRYVERIPVLGRTGPDLTMNDLKLVVDVKSRKEVPSTIFFPLMWPFCFDDVIAVRLDSLPKLWSDLCPAAPLDFTSKIICGYLAHMEEWTKVHCPDGISCVILHRPEVPIGASVAIIHSTSHRRLIEYAERCFSNSR